MRCFPIVLILCLSDVVSAWPIWPWQEKVLARTWRPSKEGFVLPEMDPEFGLDARLKEKPNFGIAIAGGGNRGVGMGQGAVRALRAAGVLDKARYLSLSSGSIWFGVPLYFQQKDSLDDFLGSSLSPEHLSPENLTSAAAGSIITRLPWPMKRYPKNMAEAGRLLGEAEPNFDLLAAAEAKWGLASGFLSEILQCFENLCLCADKLPHWSLNEIWQLIIGYVFLHPFSLAEHDSVYGHSSVIGRARASVKQYVHESQDVTHDLPFVISQSAALDPFTGRSKEKHDLWVAPLERTTLYSGTLVNRSGPYGPYGDVIVEPFAFPGKPIDPAPQAAKDWISVIRAKDTVNMGALSEWMGVGTCWLSSFPAHKGQFTNTCGIAVAEQFFPHAALWSPLNVDARTGVPVTQSIAVTDAGVYDDLGHLPLLKRGVSKLLMYDSSAVHDNATGVEKENLFEMTYMLAAFGQPNDKLPGLLPQLPGAPNAGLPRDFMTVFEPAEFPRFWARIKELYDAKLPVIVHDNFTVVDNHYWGIKGGWKVEIIWVLELPVEEWRAKLPKKTADALPSYFPNFLASEMTSQFQISAQSQFTSWLTEHHVLDKVQAMLAGANHPSQTMPGPVFV